MIMTAMANWAGLHKAQFIYYYYYHQPTLSQPNHIIVLNTYTNMCKLHFQKSLICQLTRTFTYVKCVYLFLMVNLILFCGCEPI